MIVVIIGAGLLGASLGLALGERGDEVYLADTSPLSLSLACGLGAGRAVSELDEHTAPDLVIVATPPDVTASVAARQLQRWPEAIVMDVASVKGPIMRTLASNVGACDLTRFVGAHPMAGKEKSGAPNADGELFLGRPFVVVPTESTTKLAIDTVNQLAIDIGAMPVQMDAALHDDAVAAISHLPQLMSSLLASQLLDVPEAALTLAGQGLRDTTRIAASDPLLWAAILSSNAAPLRPHVARIREALTEVLSALDACEDDTYPPAAIAKLARTIEYGAAGVAKIPGKHGGKARTYATIVVYVPDRPGQLARLFVDIGEAGVNIEDVRLEHAAGAKMGLATISVNPNQRDLVVEYLSERNWSVVAS
ncbi:MAG: prephenate dehydrogenase [Bowdeniella nasicola]|nr:prephenate dehydrogenase [Bowdeniella nasicola]